MELLKAIIEGAEPENPGPDPGNPRGSSSILWYVCGRYRATGD